VIATSNQMHFAVFVEPSTGKILHRFRTAGELASVAADGKNLVSISGDQAIHYDDRGKELRRFHHEGKIDIATLFEGGKQLVTVNDKSEIKIWDAATGKEHRTVAAPARQRPAVVSIAPDGNTLFVGTWGGDILRWDLRDGKDHSPLCGHVWSVTGLFPMSNGRSLVSVGWDNTVRRWDLATGKEEPSGKGYSQYFVFARSPDGRSIAIASCPGRLEFWDARTGKRLRNYSLPVKLFSRLRFSPDGKQLALGCSDARVRLWDVDKERVTREWKLSPQKVPGLDGISVFEGLAWSPDGRYLAASIAHTDGLWMWEAATGKEIWHEARQGVIAFAPDGKTLVSGGWDKCLTFQDAATGKLRFTVKEDRNIIDGIAFSPDGATLATCHHGGNVYLRDPKTGVVCKTLRAHQNVAWCISYSPDGKWLASSGNDAVCVWEVATGAELLCRKGHEGRVYQVEFGAEGRTVLSSSLDLTALLWDIRPSIDPGRKPSLEMLWADLASEDAPRAYQAIHQLAAVPATAIPFLRKHLRATPAVDPKRLALLIADLDSDDFAVRQKATADLEKLGELALPAYRKTLDGKPSLETRRRLEELQTKAQAAWWDVSGERLRMLRAIEVLELAGTKEAREVLETLAAGAEGARLTEEAKAALGRLTRRAGRVNAPVPAPGA
jgi:WD40 repeat protein